MNRKRKVYLASINILLLLVLSLLTGLAHGQFDLKKKMEDEVAKRVGEAVGVGSPLIVDQTTAFPEVSPPKDFRPKKITLRSQADIHKPLEPGDYSIEVVGFCTQWSIHAPGQGLAYKIGPVRGKHADAISAVLSRGSLRGVRSTELNAIAWRIQDGVPLNDWPDDDRAYVEQLAPEYEKLLSGDFLSHVKDPYNNLRNVPLLKLAPFEQMLGNMGDPGKLVLKLFEARKTLADKTLKAERLPELMYEPTDDNLPRVLPKQDKPQTSPWSDIRPGVHARFTIIEGNGGRNLFEFRIDPKPHSLNSHHDNGDEIAGSFESRNHGPAFAATPQVAEITIAILMGIAEAEEGAILATAGREALMAYAKSVGAQVLIFFPQILYNESAKDEGGANSDESGSNFPELDPDKLPEEERKKIRETEKKIEKKSVQPKSFSNTRTENGDHLPGRPGKGGYDYYDVAPAPGVKDRGPRRIIINRETGERYYTNTHYGDNKVKPSYYRMR